MWINLCDNFVNMYQYWWWLSFFGEIFFSNCESANINGDNFMYYVSCSNQQDDPPRILYLNLFKSAMHLLTSVLWSSCVQTVTKNPVNVCWTCSYCKVVSHLMELQLLQNSNLNIFSFVDIQPWNLSFS